MEANFSPARLRALRVHAGMTRPGLARRVSLAAATVKAYEQGYSTPSAQALGRLAVALGCTVDAFYDRSAADALAASRG